MSRFFVLSIVLGLSTFTMGCSSARYVSRQTDSGVVAIPANNNAWPFHYRQEGEDLIRKHVGPDYEIVEEHEEVTGTRVTNTEQTQSEAVANKKQPNMPGERVTTTGNVTSSNTSEWRITYRRRGSSTVGGPAPSVQPGVIPTSANELPLVPRQP